MIKPIHIRDGHDNFFTPLRILMAIMVVFGHAYVVQIGSSEAEPKFFYHYTFSYTAVNAFFIASGFLVSKSMMYRRKLSDYSSARILRIFPALLAHVLIVTFVIGLAVTTMPKMQYLMHPDVLTQPLKVLSFYDTRMFLPGVFETNPEPHGSAALWTLRYEVLAYIGTAIAFSLGFMKRRWMIAAPFFIMAALYAFTERSGILLDMPATLTSLMRFGLAYGLGAAIFAYQDKIKLYWPAIPVLIGATALLNGMPEMEIIGNITLAYIIFTLAYMNMPKLDGLKKLSDTSYGIYIYHWVILQVMVLSLPKMHPIALGSLALIASILTAYASWIWIEKPALKYKGRFAQSLKRTSVAPAE